MTQNQIAYHNARELERHNISTEAETARHQAVQERLQKRANDLSHESNIIQKEHYERMDAINQTHYSNMDAYNMANLAEQIRSNQANEALKQQQNAINAAGLSETIRHQMTTEAIDSRLASNTIYRTEKEMSLISPQADYIRAQTQQQWANWSYTQAQERYLNNAQTASTEAGTSYTKERQKTERTQQYLNVSRTGESIVSIWQGLIGGLSRLGVSF